MISAAKILSGHPSSKISLENMEVFANVWETQVEEWTTLLRNVTHFDKRRGSESEFFLDVSGIILFCVFIDILSIILMALVQHFF